LPAPTARESRNANRKNLEVDDGDVTEQDRTARRQCEAAG
jgi:hypothetical protein